MTEPNEQNSEIPFIPDEHMARVEEAIEQANAGLTKPTTPAFWEGLRQGVRDIGARKASIH
jgi:hypothetical protein